MQNTDKTSEDWAIVRNAQCALCGSDNVLTRHDIKSIHCGTLVKQTRLQVEVPVYKCAKCDFTYTDQEADQLCHDAACIFYRWSHRPR